MLVKRDTGIGLGSQSKYIYFIFTETSFGIYRFSSVGGAQCLSGRVLDSRPRGSGLEPHQRHCVVVLEQDTFILA